MPILTAPKLKRVHLTSHPESDPAWVDVTTTTSAGETELMEDMGASKTTPKGQLILLVVTAMIKDWNFTDESGVKLPITPDNVRHLDPQDFFEIQNAIDPTTPAPTMTPQKKRGSSASSKEKPTTGQASSK